MKGPSSMAQPRITQDLHAFVSATFTSGSQMRRQGEQWQIDSTFHITQHYVGSLLKSSLVPEYTVMFGLFLRSCWKYKPNQTSEKAAFGKRLSVCWRCLVCSTSSKEYPAQCTIILSWSCSFSSNQMYISFFICPGLFEKTCIKQLHSRTADHRKPAGPN